MTQAPSLINKRVAIIGGTSGIGFAVAELAQSLGGSVILASPTRAKVDAAVERLPGATGGVVDLKGEASIRSFLDGLEQIDHLVITGGDYDHRVFSSTEDLSLDVAREAFQARLFGSLTFIKYGRQKIGAGGSITLTSGMLAHRPRKGAILPTIVAGSVEQLVRACAIDLAPLRVNAVCPGLTLTELIVPQGSERIAAYTSGLPLPRAASPIEAAQAYTYLMMNDYLTGQILTVDGGQMLV